MLCNAWVIWCAARCIRRTTPGIASALKLCNFCNMKISEWKKVSLFLDRLGILSTIFVVACRFSNGIPCMIISWISVDDFASLQSQTGYSHIARMRWSHDWIVGIRNELRELHTMWMGKGHQITSQFSDRISLEIRSLAHTQKRRVVYAATD